MYLFNSNMIWECLWKSPLEFCPPVALFAETIAIRYGEEFGHLPSFGSYVDDIFGAFKFCSRYHRAFHYREYMCKTGLPLTLRFNMEPKKTPLPAKQLVILGLLWDTESKVVRTSGKKNAKHTSHISGFLKQKLGKDVFFACVISRFTECKLMNIPPSKVILV